jgi:ABC-type multidrug transport system permease subunit
MIGYMFRPIYSYHQADYKNNKNKRNYSELHESEISDLVCILLLLHVWFWDLKLMQLWIFPFVFVFIISLMMALYQPTLLADFIW